MTHQQGKIYVGRAKALHVAGVGHLPELGTRHHPREVGEVVAVWLAGGEDRVVYNPYTLDPIPPEQAHRVVCVALADDGRAVMKPITDEPRFREYVMDGHLQLGELWGSCGEDWVLDP